MSNFKKFLALVLATLMVASAMVFTAPAAAAAEYAPTGDYAADIALLNSLGVMLGNGVDSFLEKENVTRWQMAILVAKVVTGDTTYTWGGEKSAYYTDVDASDYPEAIDFCHEMGYIRGTGDGKFDPDGYITYQDGLTLLVRLLGYETASITYPWGYILKARELATTDGDLLTADIDTGNKTPLLREEVANLVAKAIKINTATIVDGVAVPTKNTLLKTGLKAQDLGKATLVATWNASINADNYPETKYGEATFKYVKSYNDDGSVKEYGTKTVKVDNISNTGKFDLNELIGFYADIVVVKNTVLAAMSDVVVVDSYKVVEDETTGIENAVKIGDVVIPAGSIRTYGTTNSKVFVANTGEIDTNGRILVSDINNDGVDKYDLARYIPFNSVKAVYVAKNIKVTADEDGYFPEDGKVDVYYTSKNYYKASVATSATTLEPAKLYGINNTGWNGALEKSGISKDATGYNKGLLKEIAANKVATAYKNTSLYVSVYGDLKAGEVFRGAIHKVGELTFVTVVNYVDIQKGTGILTGSDNNTGVYIGETLIPVGYNTTAIALPKVGGIASSSAVDGNLEKVKVNGADKYVGWYTQFTDVNVLAGNTFNDLMGHQVNYVTVDGKIVNLSLFIEAQDKHTSPYVNGHLILNIKDDGKNVTLNADNTITVNVYNTATMAYEDVKLDQVNGTKLGQYANSLGLNATARLLNVPNADDVKAVSEILSFLVKDATWKNTVGKYELVLVATVNNVDGVYSISTTDEEVNKISRPAIVAGLADSALKNKKDTAVAFDITFTAYEGKAISTEAAFQTGTHTPAVGSADNWTFANTFLTVTKDTKYVVVGSDGIATVTKTLPESGDMIKIDEANTFILALDNNNVVLFTKSATDAVVTFTEDVVGTPVNTSGNWYTLTWTSKFVGTEVVVDDEDNRTFRYSFTQLRNLTTGADEDVVIVSSVYTANPAKDFFGASWIADGTKEAVKGVADSKSGKLSADFASSPIYRVFYISETGEFAESSMISWALANEYKVGVITDMVSKNPNILVIDEYEVATKDGYYQVSLKTTGAVKSVIGFNVTYFNLSTGIIDDEITTKDHNISGDHIKKILGTLSSLADDQKFADYCFYKINKDGTADVIVNMFDGVRSNTNIFVDDLAIAD